MDVDTGTSKYDLFLELDERADEILARFHYSTDLFDALSIVRMTAHWQQLLERPSPNPGSGSRSCDSRTRRTGANSGAVE